MTKTQHSKIAIRQAVRSARDVWEDSSWQEQDGMAKRYRTLKDSYEAVPANYGLYEVLEDALGVDYIWDEEHEETVNLFTAEFFKELSLFAKKHYSH